MYAFIARRFVLSIPVLILVSLMVFILINIVPGDPARAILGPEASHQDLENFRLMHGLDKPLTVQYVTWLGNAVRGDLGRSLVDRTPVSRLISQRLPVTAQIALGAFLVALVVAIPAGIAAAAGRGSLSDYGGTIFALAGLSVPQFWLGIMLIMFLAVRLRWLPASGFVPFSQDPMRNLASIAMPVVVTGLREAAIIMRLLRSSLLDALGEDYIRTAASKGLGRWLVVLKHGVRNALIPVLTVSGTQLAGLFGGLVITEQIFVIPGFGRLILDSILYRDFVTLQGAVLVSALIVVAVNFLVDVMYAVVDPRIRLGTGTK